jgi:hypothetical protein
MKLNRRARWNILSGEVVYRLNPMSSPVNQFNQR